MIAAPALAVPAMPERARAGLTLACAFAGGVLVDAAHLDGALWPLAWLGVALLAVALTQPVRAGWAAAGLLLGAIAGHWVGYAWQFQSLASYLPGGTAEAARWVGPATLAWVLPLRLPLLVAWLVGRRFGVPVWIWLPVGWMAGEALWEAISGFSPDAWLYSQWRNPLVLKAAGHLGWLGALGLCLAMAASAAEGLVRRAWQQTIPFVLGLVVLLALPALPTGSLAALNDVGAVHMANYFHPPKAAPVGVKLLVWPEIARGGVPRLEEGPGDGLRIRSPFESADVHHLMGTRTRSHLGLQNTMVALAPDGTVEAARAKSRLFPLTERAAVGLSLREGYRPGRGMPVLEAAGKRLTALLCVEGFDRGLAAEGRRAGAEFVALACNESALGGSEIGMRQMLAAAVFCAVEARMPVVRSSFQGIAALIGADGRILASANPGTDGVLTLPGSPAAGSAVAVLYSTASPEMRAALPAGRVTAYPIEGFRPSGARAEVVIVAGHAEPPSYLGHSPEEVAAAVASFEPSLVVMDTCFGASTPILGALAREGLDAWVVAPPYRIPDTGLVYEPGFLASTPIAERARRVRTEPAYPLLRWRLDGATIARIEAEGAALDMRGRRKRLLSLNPPLVRMPIAGGLEPEVPVLVPIPATTSVRSGK